MKMQEGAPVMIDLISESSCDKEVSLSNSSDISLSTSDDSTTNCEHVLIPEAILNVPYWQGIASSSNIQCQHNKTARKKVCWDGKNTGRRFLGCPKDGPRRCAFVHWIDKNWPKCAQLAFEEMWRDIKKYKKATHKSMAQRDQAIAQRDEAMKKLSKLKSRVNQLQDQPTAKNRKEQMSEIHMDPIEPFTNLPRQTAILGDHLGGVWLESEWNGTVPFLILRVEWLYFCVWLEG